MSSAHIPIIKNAGEIPLPSMKRRHFARIRQSQNVGMGPIFWVKILARHLDWTGCRSTLAMCDPGKPPWCAAGVTKKPFSCYSLMDARLGWAERRQNMLCLCSPVRRLLWRSSTQG